MSPHFAPTAAASRRIARAVLLSYLAAACTTWRTAALVAGGVVTLALVGTILLGVVISSGR
jgi:hypothetical protein